MSVVKKMHLLEKISGIEKRICKNISFSSGGPEQTSCTCPSSGNWGWAIHFFNVNDLAGDAAAAAICVTSITICLEQSTLDGSFAGEEGLLNAHLIIGNDIVDHFQKRGVFSRDRDLHKTTYELTDLKIFPAGCEELRPGKIIVCAPHSATGLDLTLTYIEMDGESVAAMENKENLAVLMHGRIWRRDRYSGGFTKL